MDIQTIVSTTLQGVIAAATPVAVYYVRKFMLQHFNLKKISLEVAHAANQAGFNLTSEQVAQTVREAFEFAKKDILAGVTVGNVTVTTPKPVVRQAQESTAPLPGKIVMGLDFICNFPDPTKPDNYHFFTSADEGYDQLCTDVGQFAEMVGISKIQYYAALHI